MEVLFMTCTLRKGYLKQVINIMCLNNNVVRLLINGVLWFLIAFFTLVEISRNNYELITCLYILKKKMCFS